MFWICLLLRCVSSHPHPPKKKQDTHTHMLWKKTTLTLHVFLSDKQPQNKDVTKTSFERKNVTKKVKNKQVKTDPSPHPRLLHMATPPQCLHNTHLSNTWGPLPTISIPSTLKRAWKFCDQRLGRSPLRFCRLPTTFV